MNREESVIKNPLYGQQCNPERMEWLRQDNPYHRPYDDPRFPYVLTTYRLTEHHTAGGMSRWLSWLSELQPEMFCEVSPELAAERGLKNGGWATIRTARAEIEARVLVTRAHAAAADQGPHDSSDRLAVSLVEQRTGARRCGERADRVRRGSERLDSGIEGVHRQHRAGPQSKGRRHVTSGPLRSRSARRAWRARFAAKRGTSLKRSTDLRREEAKEGNV